MDFGIASPFPNMQKNGKEYHMSTHFPAPLMPLQGQDQGGAGKLLSVPVGGDAHSPGGQGQGGPCERCPP